MYSARPRGTIIFGATGGIGKSIAARLVAGGEQVFLAGRSEEELKVLSSELDQPYGIFSLQEPSSMEQLFQRARDELSSVTGVVNGIGSVLLKPAHLTTLEEFAEILEVNLTSSFLLMRLGIRLFQDLRSVDSEEGVPVDRSLLFFSSAAASIGLANHEAIAAAKGGIEAMVRSAAASYAGKGIRVNAIAPGLVETKMTERITQNSASRSYSEKLHPVAGLGEPQHISSGAVWLLSEEQQWVSGHILHIDGGLSNIKG
jgi:NAD(P)-dependent dehydrogenase (short-subunit alcohol dehydrogenase family)